MIKQVGRVSLRFFRDQTTTRAQLKKFSFHSIVSYMDPFMSQRKSIPSRTRNWQKKKKGKKILIYIRNTRLLTAHPILATAEGKKKKVKRNSRAATTNLYKAENTRTLSEFNFPNCSGLNIVLFV